MTHSLLPSARALELIMDELGEHASARQAWVLLRVAAAGHTGIEQGEIVRAIGTASATRITQSLSTVGWRRDEHGYRCTGAGLIESHADHQDLRRRRLTLTAAGRRLVELLETTAE